MPFLLVGAYYAHDINEWSTPLYAPGIFWHIVRMKRLGQGKTVRVFVPMPEELRDKVHAMAAKRGIGMAEWIRDKIAIEFNQEWKVKK